MGEIILSAAIITPVSRGLEALLASRLVFYHRRGDYLGKGDTMEINFTINGKEYKAKEFTLNLICDLESMGINLATIQENNKSFYRAYLALCGNMDLQTAGWEIEKHLVSGGDLFEFDDAILQMTEKSALFNALSQKEDSQEWKGIRLIHSV